MIVIIILIWNCFYFLLITTLTVSKAESRKLVLPHSLATLIAISSPSSFRASLYPKINNLNCFSAHGHKGWNFSPHLKHKPLLFISVNLGVLHGAGLCFSNPATKAAINFPEVKGASNSLNKLNQWLVDPSILSFFQFNFDTLTCSEFQNRF